MELEKAERIAEALTTMLQYACERIQIAGSIRRQKPYPNDIELLCIPKYSGDIDMLDAAVKGLMAERILDFRLNKRGSKVYGKQNKLLLHRRSGIGVDIFTTDEQRWPVALVVRTGGKTTNQRIATAALQKGYRFHAYGSGFTTPSGEIVCRSEREVFEVVGLPYLPPEERE